MRSSRKRCMQPGSIVNRRVCLPCHHQVCFSSPIGACCKDDTLIIFTSDNGGPIYEPGAASNHPLLGSNEGLLAVMRLRSCRCCASWTRWQVHGLGRRCANKRLDFGWFCPSTEATDFKFRHRLHNRSPAWPQLPGAAQNTMELLTWLTGACAEFTVTV